MCSVGRAQSPLWEPCNSWVVELPERNLRDVAPQVGTESLIVFFGSGYAPPLYLSLYVSP